MADNLTGERIAFCECRVKFCPDTKKATRCRFIYRFCTGIDGGNLRDNRDPLDPVFDLCLPARRISIGSPSRRMPRMRDPPTTPPFTSFQLQPGLLMSKDRATSIIGSAAGSRTGSGMVISRACTNAPMLIPFWAETGMMGAFSATVPFTNALICW